MGQAVQFQGINQVMKAYDLREDEKFWAVFQSKSFLHRGEGRDNLVDFLNLLAQSESTAIYTLKVYDDVNSVSDIRERTEASGSFNFQLHEAGASRSDYYLKYEARLKALEEGDDEEEDIGIMGKIGNAAVSILSDPDKLTSVLNSLPNIIGAVKDLIRAPNGMQAIGVIAREYATGATAAAMGSENNILEKSKQKNTIEMSQDQKLQKLSAALDKLEKNDKNIVEHLEKLAELSESNPQLFKMLIKNLEEL